MYRIGSRPPRDPDIEAEITYRPTAEGGRAEAARSGYRPLHDFGIPGILNDAQHEYPDVDGVPPGATARALLWFLSPDDQAGRLSPGFTFTVQDGMRVVGSGVVSRVLNPLLVASA